MNLSRERYSACCSPNRTDSLTTRKLVLLNIEFDGGTELVDKLMKMVASRGVGLLSHIVQTLPSTKHAKAVFLLDITGLEGLLSDLMSDIRKMSEIVRAEVMDAPISPGEARLVVFTLADLNGFFKLFRELGTGGQAMIFHLGLRAGEDLADRITAQCKDRYATLDQSLLYMESMGYGRFKVEEYVDRKRCKIIIHESIECMGHCSTTPCSHLLRGLISGVIGKIWGKKVAVIETKCIAQGNPHCEFIVEAE